MTLLGQLKSIDVNTVRIGADIDFVKTSCLQK